jgi:serine protease
MKRILTVILAAVSFACFAQKAAIVENEVIVQLKKNSHPSTVVQQFEAEFGILPGLKWEKCLSEPMQAWLFSFDPNQLSAREVCTMLSTLPSIQTAQVNHIIQERIVPNDPFFGLQWHHSQSNNKDINSDLAWDITTGGLTATGDEIVVCVIETQGAKWDQADILANHWVNAHEIAGNGVDDDGNGYVDDVDGWNISNDTDNLSQGNHGTQVSSMIGAKGDNGTGITGVNWDVKIMQVQMGGISEANVVEAYTYPLRMRKLYNETAGELGAFVVATNSSWGTDFGQPSEAPIWCAMYDSLGYYGVLSCGATANNDVDIDAEGDLPTACPSPYLISVTATNDNDVRTFSGYGTLHVDLGAPGEDVYLASNNSYGTTSGTSFATPCVAGAVALLYSAPCPTFMPLVYSSPAEAAILMRDFIFDGVTPVPNLAGETATGGRLDVFSSLNLLLQSCPSTDCLPPYSLVVQPIAGSADYLLAWNHIATQSQFTVRLRPENAADWTTIENAVAPLVLSGLANCVTYEIQVSSLCDGVPSDWSASYTLLTDGCCNHPSYLTTLSQMGSEMTISFEPILAANGYTIEVMHDGTLVTTLNSNSPELQLIAGLEPCTFYEVLISSNCESSAPANAFEVFSQGCTDCEAIEHCPVSGNSTSEWISQVQLNSLLNNTEDEPNGYGNYSNISTELVWGETYTISVTPDFSGATYTESIRAWIDYNSDGNFDESELILSPAAPSSTTVSGTFTVPNHTIGSVTLRVAMAYHSIFGGGSEAEPCGNITFGEAEDYCVELTNIISTTELASSERAVSVYPNPCTHLLFAKGTSSGTFEVLDLSGRLVNSGSYREGEPIQTSMLRAGYYAIRLTSKEGFIQTLPFIKE